MQLPDMTAEELDDITMEYEGYSPTLWKNINEGHKVLWRKRVLELYALIQAKVNKTEDDSDNYWKGLANHVAIDNGVRFPVTPVAQAGDQVSAGPVEGFFGEGSGGKVRE